MLLIFHTPDRDNKRKRSEKLSVVGGSNFYYYLLSLPFFRWISFPSPLTSCCSAFFLFNNLTYIHRTTRRRSSLSWTETVTFIVCFPHFFAISCSAVLFGYSICITQWLEKIFAQCKRIHTDRIKSLSDKTICFLRFLFVKKMKQNTKSSINLLNFWKIPSFQSFFFGRSPHVLTLLTWHIKIE